LIDPLPPAQLEVPPVGSPVVPARTPIVAFRRGSSLFEVLAYKNVLMSLIILNRSTNRGEIICLFLVVLDQLL